MLEDEEPCCYFIDGLDEVCGKDDPFKVRQFIGKILNFPKIKICVSTRQETIITDWVRKLNIPRLLLEDLTKPDIQAFVHKALNPFFANGALKKETFLLLKITLVFKAQGVFLWIYLAIVSIKSGIYHQDSEDILLSHLEQLPDELEKLYADMWRRMNKNNSIYAQQAARYLSYVLEKDWYVPMITGVGPATLDPEISQPTLFQVACAENFKAHEILLGSSVTTSGVELHSLHKEAPLEVQNRCAGLLLWSKPRQGGIDELQTVAIVNGVNPDLRTMPRTSLMCCLAMSNLFTVLLTTFWSIRKRVKRSSNVVSYRKGRRGFVSSKACSVFFDFFTLNTVLSGSSCVTFIVCLSY